MEKLKSVILAAGQGTRMKSELPKVMHEILGKNLLQYVIDASKEAGAENTVVVVGHKSEVITENIKGVQFAMQAERLGTGHAVKMAEPFIDDDEDVLILYGDTPLITADGLKDLIHLHRRKDAAVTVVSIFLDNPKGYGRIVREQGNFKEIVEEKDAVGEQLKICEINTGVYCFKGRELKYALSLLKNNNSQNEYYITDTLSILLNSGKNVEVFVSENPDEYNGINSRVQLAQAAKYMKLKVNEMHMDGGVTVIDPDNTYIGPDVKIGMDTVIYPGTVIEGHTEIGSNTVIGTNCTIKNTVLGNGVKADKSVIDSARVGDGTTIGPFAYIRPKSDIGRNVKIGDFVEVKNAVIGDNTKASHLTYIGDADIGSNINFGCGTVVVNYDGKNKFRTVVKDNAFIGCNSNLVSPVTVNEGAYIGAGSTITDEVPANALAIARARQVIKTQWKRKM